MIINLSTTFPCADIVDSNFARLSFTKSFDMSINKICDIDVVPYASSISGRVVRSSNLKGADQKSYTVIILCNVKVMDARMRMSI